MGRNKEKVEGMKRKIAGILLAGLLTFSGTGCAQNGEAAENSSSVSNSQSVSESTSNSQSVSESISNSQSVESTSGVSGGERHNTNADGRPRRRNGFRSAFHRKKECRLTILL